MGGTSDPYVKAIITPSNKKYHLETKTKMKTLNPEWKETFYFEGKNAKVVDISTILTLSSSLTDVAGLRMLFFSLGFFVTTIKTIST